MAGERAEDAVEPEDAQVLFRCDFCGEEVPRVQRVALDAGYDRLAPHAAQYACERCSEAKERERRAQGAGGEGGA